MHLSWFVWLYVNWVLLLKIIVIRYWFFSWMSYLFVSCVWFKNVWLSNTVRTRSLAWIKSITILVIVFFIIWWKRISCIIRRLISGMVFICIFFILLKTWVILILFLWGSWLIIKVYWIWSCLWYILTFWKEVVLSICFRRFCCFWSIYIVVILFCKIISMWCLLFVWWFIYWSECWIIHLQIFLGNRGFYCGLYDCLL